jgi:protein SCO1/2
VLASGVALVAAALAVLLVACAPSRPPLPEYDPAPTFALFDQTGASFSSADVRGRVVLADFIYTRCTDVCPLISAKMQEVQARLKRENLFGSRVLLLSFSVDPDHDTPEVLASYARRFQADPAGWRLLTGDREIVRQLLPYGWKVGAPDLGPPRGDDPNWMHTTRFVLVDRAGRVRGYPMLSDLDLDELVQDVRALSR